MSRWKCRGMAAELKKRTGLISANASIREMLVEMLNGTYAGGMTSRQEYHLRSRNLIEPGRPIRLADLGRWQAIMQKMRLSPMEMFLLSDMYVDYTMRKEGSMKPFPYDFRPLENLWKVMMDMGTIYNQFWRLKRYGAIEKTGTKFYTITERWARRLDRYRDDVFAMNEAVHCGIPYQ